mmetsp:Transcript_37173/g.73009  ORF Transcript_37173/g.73009 Transcript_37173/m.73009 type:complete len:83 (-) Transcript_37173:245-493(-)
MCCFFSLTTPHIDKGGAIMNGREHKKERDLAILSAVTTYDWKEYYTHMIDTCGHVDFTLEVPGSLRVPDGCVALCDGVAGVE